MWRAKRFIAVVIALFAVSLAGAYFLRHPWPTARRLDTYTQVEDRPYLLPAPEDITWEYVPMRTAAEKAAGRGGGEMGQMAFTLDISRVNPNFMAMGIDTAGVYVSEDGGVNWELRRKGIMSNGVQSVAFDPVNPDVMWAAGLASVPDTPRTYPPDPNFYDPDADGIYRSTDRGRTWELVLNTAYLRGNAQNVYFAFDPASAGANGCRTVWAITHSYGLIKTTDGGYNWQSVGPQSIIGNAVARDASTGWMWLAADQGLWLSQNNGATWTQKTVPGGPVRALAVDPANPSRVFVGLYTDGMYRTTNAGSSWQKMATPLDDLDWLGGIIPWTTIAISPSNPNYLYADAIWVGWGTPVYTHDGGNTWHMLESRQESFTPLVFWAEGLMVHPTNPNVAYHLSPMRRTTDGGRTWQLIGNGVGGFRRNSAQSIAFDPNDAKRMVFFHVDHGSTITRDGGDTWEYIPAPRQEDIGAITQYSGALDPRPGGSTIFTAVGGWTYQRFAVSTDTGHNWSVSDPDNDSSSDLDNFPFMAWSAQNPNLIYVGRSDDALRSEDGGRTWAVINKPVRAMFHGNGDIIYAIVSNTSGYAWTSQIQMSYDRGRTWQSVGSSMPYVSDIAVDPVDPLRLYAATSWGGVWVYNGSSWSARGEDFGMEADWFGEMNFLSVETDPTRPGVVYAGQNHSWRGLARGIFRSTDYGETWANISGNLGPDLNVWDIMVSPHDGTVWLGTDYGNWRWTPDSGASTSPPTVPPPVSAGGALVGTFNGLLLNRN